MDMESALLARILEAPAVAALVDDRGAWVERPEWEEMPALTLQVISNPRAQTTKGFQALQFTRVQADCWGHDYAETKALAEAVVAAAVGPATKGGIKFRRASVEGPRDLGEQTANGFVHRKSLDLIVRHSAA